MKTKDRLLLSVIVINGMMALGMLCVLVERISLALFLGWKLSMGRWIVSDASVHGWTLYAVPIVSVVCIATSMVGVHRNEMNARYLAIVSASVAALSLVFFASLLCRNVVLGWSAQ
ncbi:MAG TPA: hypothetical protein VM621_01965 [Luteibacter sp.]|uniref:hypothetical protein n=1 Tax=Luteibacter sp. TaxID=1886636 RepID=UPI002B685D99|nr:hypothetical protein [Luteibacter sp.]HVI53801.1 hypothetical protein [Luteibacter sp.]